MTIGINLKDVSSAARRLIEARRLDANGDGVFSPQERAARKKSKASDMDAAATQIFEEALKVERQGAAPSSKFEAPIPAKDFGSGVRRAVAELRELDRNVDGFISADELPSSLSPTTDTLAGLATMMGPGAPSR